MKMLIALDGSSFSEAILEPASKLADNENAEVYLMRVVRSSHIHRGWADRATSEHVLVIESEISGGTLPQGSAGTGTPVETRYQAEERSQHIAEEYLENVERRFFPGRGQKKVVIKEDPADEIAAFARSEGVDLIALATHGRSGVARLLMSSVANKLLNSGVAPLLLVRPEGLR